MERVEPPQIRILVNSPQQTTDLDDYSPFEAEDPDALVFCCFFRTPEVRAEFLTRLRATAKEPPPADSEREELDAALPFEYERLLSEGDAAGALSAAVRWWVRGHRHSYHVYSLKTGIGPYRTSCIVAFDELGADTMRFHLASALDLLEREKARVEDFFSWMDQR